VFQTLKDTIHRGFVANRQRQEHRSTFEKIEAAIRTPNLLELREQLTPVRGESRKGFIETHGSTMMRAAIETGNMPVFREAYAFLDNPNFMLQYHATSNTGAHQSWTQSILYTAIMGRKQAIAELVASDPKVDITKGGRDGERPLDMARKVKTKGEGMEPVVAILSLRTAKLLRDQAERLELQVKSEGMPPSLMAGWDAHTGAKPRPVEVADENFPLTGRAIPPYKASLSSKTAGRAR
jgi:hypothetical protein